MRRDRLLFVPEGEGVTYQKGGPVSIFNRAKESRKVSQDYSSSVGVCIFFKKRDHRFF